MPPGYPGRPIIHSDLLFVWDAFWELCSDRQVGFGEGRIPSFALRAWAADHGLNHYLDLRWFTECIRGMDREYLEHTKPKDGKQGVREVRLDDHAGVKALFRQAAALREKDEGETTPEEN